MAAAAAAAASLLPANSCDKKVEADDFATIFNALSFTLALDV